MTRCDWDARSFAVTAVTPSEGPTLIERTIRFDLGTEELVIDDRHCSGGSVISQYLLGPRTAVTVDKAVGARLDHEVEDLRLLTGSKIEVAEGLISFARHQIEKTVMLRLAGVRNEVRIRIVNDLSRLAVYRTSNQYPYAKREITDRAWECRIAARLHAARLKQLSLLLVIEAAVVLIVATIMPLA